MNSKFIVIDSNGVQYDPGLFIKSNEVHEDFIKLVEQEALGRPVDKNSNSDYIEKANKLGFKWESSAGAGFLQYDHKADLMMRLVKEYARKLVHGIGFPIYEVRGSNFFDMNYPVVEAYANLFGDRLFKHNYGKKALVMSYDASYPQFNLAHSYKLQEKALPFGHFSISDCYRYEKSGECMLLYRNRRFFMPDLHPYFRDVDEAFDWFPQIEAKLLQAGEAVNGEYWNVVKVSSEKYFEEYKKQISAIAKRRNQPILVDIRKDDVDRYWIIDVDYSIVDKLGQCREICCIQVDVGNAERLGIKFEDSNGNEKHPVIIHSAVPGGIERYIYMAIDKNSKLPLCLSPVQLRLIPVGKDFNEISMKFAQIAGKKGIRVEIDDRDESVSKKIKNAHKDLVPEVIVIGEKEVNNEQLLMEQIEEIAQRVESFPFIDLGWPHQISHQVK